MKHVFYKLSLAVFICNFAFHGTAQEIIINNEFGIEPGTITRDNKGNVLIGAYLYTITSSKGQIETGKFIKL